MMMTLRLRLFLLVAFLIGFVVATTEDLYERYPSESTYDDSLEFRDVYAEDILPGRSLHERNVLARAVVDLIKAEYASRGFEDEEEVVLERRKGHKNRKRVNPAPAPTVHVVGPNQDHGLLPLSGAIWDDIRSTVWGDLNLPVSAMGTIRLTWGGNEPQDYNQSMEAQGVQDGDTIHYTISTAGASGSGGGLRAASSKTAKTKSIKKGIQGKAGEAVVKSTTTKKSSGKNEALGKGTGGKSAPKKRNGGGGGAKKGNK